MLRPQDIKDAILVTHRNCMDGAGCAIMFLAAGGKKENIRYIAAGMVERFVKKDPIWKSDRFIIFADLGLNIPEYSDVMEKRGNCVVLDHHSTSQHMSGRYWTTIDMDACGCELLRRYLVEGGFMKEQIDDAYRKLAHIIDDFDRFILNDNRSDDMSMLMTFYGQEMFVEEFLRPYLRFEDERFWTDFELKTLKVLQRRRTEAIERILKKVKVREVNIDEFFNYPIRIAYVVTGDPNISKVMDAVLVNNPDCMMAVCVDPDRNSISLRSKGIVDVGQFASIFGGGGHRGAAGHPVPPDLFDNMVDEVHLIGTSTIERVGR